MSTKPKTTKSKNTKNNTINLGKADFSVDSLELSDGGSVDETEKKSRGKGRPAAANKNGEIRSRLGLLADMLENIDDMDDKTLRHNAKLAERHLRELMLLL